VLIGMVTIDDMLHVAEATEDIHTLVDLTGLVIYFTVAAPLLRGTLL
jgi:hypothetical protein